MKLDRRTFLQSFLSLPLAAFAGRLAEPAQSKQAGFQYSHPGDRLWPSEEQWKRLNAQVSGRLIQPTSPLHFCGDTPKSESCIQALQNLQNPYFIEDEPGATQSTGWLNAWTSTPSPYAVAAKNAEDVAAAVHFARKHRIRLVIKGTGHDYLGRSCAPDSLLIWTHQMRETSLQNDFLPKGAPRGTQSMIVLHVSAGNRWLEAYQETTVKHGRYVQGGGCTSVGACGGFILGGGFGSFSKKFGTGAAGLIEAEVVTADGKIRIANEYQNADLFWALRGGGGGTFGVVTRMTLLTHPVPERFGIVEGKIKAASDQEFREIITRFLQFYDEELNHEHWGEQFSFQPDNTLNVFLAFQDLPEELVKTKFARFDPKSFHVATIPARELWNVEFLEKNLPALIQRDPRPGQPPAQYWWASNSEEVSMYWYSYQSRWIPASLFKAPDRPNFARQIFDASRNWPVVFHINKGLAGASADAVQRGKNTSVNPVVYDAAALVIIASGERGIFPNVPGHAPDPIVAKQQAERVSRAMKFIRDATPESGSYVNETDYFEPDWQKSFWGVHYPRLLSIKRKYDPEGFFRTHHSVGSEEP